MHDDNDHTGVMSWCLFGVVVKVVLNSSACFYIGPFLTFRIPVTKFLLIMLCCVSELNGEAATKLHSFLIAVSQKKVLYLMMVIEEPCSLQSNCSFP